MKTYRYTVHFEPAEEGGYVVTVPALPGCVTQGESYDEAVAMAEECIRGFVEALEKAGQPIPREEEPVRPVQALIQVHMQAPA
jgi:predicted RNase H-like HicB family nuclease